ncbi:hypothetical protein ACHWQZ_G017024 [Mnemiopsis leidyi]
MWYIIPFVYTICSAALFETRLDQECSKLQLQFATASSDFTTCLGKNTKPVRICVTCFDNYQVLNSSFFNITTNQNCSNLLLQSDNAMVIQRLWDSYANMWSSALCDTCSGLTENRTHEFRNKTDEVLDCFWQNEKQHTPELICGECNKKYDELLNLFKSLQSYGYACADLADSMNSTAQSWSVRYQCGHPPVEYVPVLAMTIGISLLPVVFYSALWFIP